MKLRDLVISEPEEFEVEADSIRFITTGELRMAAKQQALADAWC